MNAPVTASQMAPATLKILKLDQLTPSSTHVQAMRRKRFDQGKLAEFAAGSRARAAVRKMMGTV